jgi:dGTPase
LLEQKYPNFPGLNLTWEVREGLAKHQTAYDHPERRKGFDSKNSSLEAQIANLADEITYYSHDLDDGLDSELLSEKKLIRDVRIFAQAARLVKKEFGNLADESRRYFIIRTIIDMQIHDVVENSEWLIQDAKVNSADDVRRFPKALIQHSSERRKLNLELRDYLYKNLYYNPVVHQPNLRAVKMLGLLFKHFLAHPKEMGEGAQKRIKKSGLHRAVCDYIAGMTDRYVMLECQRIFGQTPKV